MNAPRGLRKEVLVPGHEAGGLPSTMDEKTSGLGTVGHFMERNFRHLNDRQHRHPSRCCSFLSYGANTSANIPLYAEARWLCCRNANKSALI